MSVRGVLLVLAVVLLSTNALPFLATIFQANMVLQSGRPILVWGWDTAPATTVSLNINGIGYKNMSATIPTVRGAYYWSVTLAPLPVSFTPLTMFIKSTSNNVQVLSNILVGDVYLCGGQSNAQMSVIASLNGTAEAAIAGNYASSIRLFTVGQTNSSATPFDDFAKIEQGWSPADQKSVGNGPWTYFSALCWHFAKKLQDQYPGSRPIGVVSSNWGGTMIEPWMSPSSYRYCAGSSKPFMDTPRNPSSLYNAMIRPMLGFNFRGALWYQGESNVYSKDADLYTCQLKALMQDWRASFGAQTDSDMPFFVIQLAPYTQGISDTDHLPNMRLYQAAASDSAYVALVTAIDTGDLASKQGNIHPMDKKTLGVRAAKAAGYLIYNDQSQLPIRGPVATSFSVVSQGPSASVQVSFDPATVTQLSLRQEPGCPQGVNPTWCAGFEVLSGVDGKWRAANATTVSDSNQLNVVSSALPSGKITGVRYAFANWPLVSLYDNSGLPAYPFVLTQQ